MTTTQLRYFLKTAQTRSMTATAMALSVSQPAVSNAIRELEAEYDVALFSRSGRELTLTEQGKEFLDIAESLIAHFDNADEALRHLEEPPTTFSVALTNNYSCLFLSPLCAWLRERLPEYRFQFHNLSAAGIVSGLTDRQIDIGCLSAEATELQPLRCIRVRDFRLDLCLSEKLARLPDGPAALSQIAPLPLALYRQGSSHNRLVRRSFAREGLTPNVCFELEQLYAIRELVCDGQAAAFLDPGLFRHDPAVRFHPVRAQGFALPIYLAFRRESEPLRRVLRCMRQFFSASAEDAGT